MAPRGSIVFAAVGAEELGLLGSNYWVERPTWPLAQFVANLNGGDAEAWRPPILLAFRLKGRLDFLFLALYKLKRLS